MTEDKKSWFRGALDKVEGQIESQKAQHAASAARAGNLMIQKSFGTSTVAIYDGGYVRVSRVLNSVTPLTPYEKLRSIKYLEQVQDRSGIGYALQGGPIASRQRKTITLTIATDRKVHALKTESQMLSNDDKAGMALEAAGRGILDSFGSSAAASLIPAQTTQPDVAEQIRSWQICMRQGSHR